MKYPQVQIIIDILSRVDNSAKSKLAFDMNTPYERMHTDHKCGSACCIGGWAHRTMKLVYDDKCPSIQTALSRLTGIPSEDAYAICFPNCDHDTVSLQVALKTLEHYRDTGKIDYKRGGAKRCKST